MENFSEEYSKLLDETGRHLSLQALATYINLSDLLSEKEKQFISNHLSDCQQCSNAFNSVFDEDLNIDEKKNIISLYRHPEDSDKETAIIRSEDSLIEIEITRISQSDFNLRFLSLPSGFNNQKAALKDDSGYILRVLSMDTETMFIIQSSNDIMNLDKFELVTIAVPVAIPQILKSGRTFRAIRFVWFAAAAVIILAAVLIIYFTTRSGEEIQDKNESSRVITSLTPGQKSMSMADTVSSVKPVPSEEEAVPLQQDTEITDNFALNEFLENSIVKNNGSESQIEIISPSAGATVKMPVRFEWMSTRKNMTIRFSIVTNRNSPVYEGLINGNQLTIDTKLDPGLYYWKLEYSDTNETIGKFIIR